MNYKKQINKSIKGGINSSMQTITSLIPNTKSHEISSIETQPPTPTLKSHQVSNSQQLQSHKSTLIKQKQPTLTPSPPQKLQQVSNQYENILSTKSQKNISSTKSQKKIPSTKSQKKIPKISSIRTHTKTHTKKLTKTNKQETSRPKTNTLNILKPDRKSKQNTPLTKTQGNFIRRLSIPHTYKPNTPSIKTTISYILKNSRKETPNIYRIKTPNTKEIPLVDIIFPDNPEYFTKINNHIKNDKELSNKINEIINIIGDGIKNNYRKSGIDGDNNGIKIMNFIMESKDPILKDKLTELLKIIIAKSKDTTLNDHIFNVQNSSKEDILYMNFINLFKNLNIDIEMPEGIKEKLKNTTVNTEDRKKINNNNNIITSKILDELKEIIPPPDSISAKLKGTLFKYYEEHAKIQRNFNNNNKNEINEFINLNELAYNPNNAFKKVKEIYKDYEIQNNELKQKNKNDKIKNLYKKLINEYPNISNSNIKEIFKLNNIKLQKLKEQFKINDSDKTKTGGIINSNINKNKELYIFIYKELQKIYKKDKYIDIDNFKIKIFDKLKQKYKNVNKKQINNILDNLKDKNILQVINNNYNIIKGGIFNYIPAVSYDFIYTPIVSLGAEFVDYLDKNIDKFNNIKVETGCKIIDKVVYFLKTIVFYISKGPIYILKGLIYLLIPILGYVASNILILILNIILFIINEIHLRIYYISLNDYLRIYYISLNDFLIKYNIYDKEIYNDYIKNPLKTHLIKSPTKDVINKYNGIYKNMILSLYKEINKLQNNQSIYDNIHPNNIYIENTNNINRPYNILFKNNSPQSINDYIINESNVNNVINPKLILISLLYSDYSSHYNTLKNNNPYDQTFKIIKENYYKIYNQELIPYFNKLYENYKINKNSMNFINTFKYTRPQNSLNHNFKDKLKHYINYYINQIYIYYLYKLLCNINIKYTPVYFNNTLDNFFPDIEIYHEPLLQFAQKINEDDLYVNYNYIYIFYYQFKNLLMNFINIHILNKYVNNRENFKHIIINVKSGYNNYKIKDWFIFNYKLFTNNDELLTNTNEEEFNNNLYYFLINYDNKLKSIYDILNSNINIDNFINILTIIVYFYNIQFNNNNYNLLFNIYNNLRLEEKKDYFNSILLKLIDTL